MCVQLSTAQVGLDWLQRYGAAGFVPPNGFAVDGSGNTYITSRVWSGQTWDVLTLKRDRSGNLKWARTWDGTWDTTDVGVAVAVDRLGSVYVLSREARHHTLISRYHVIKYDSSGVLLWVATPDVAPMDEWIGTDYDEIALDSAGNLYTALGAEEAYYDENNYLHYNNRVILLKVSPGGGIQWQRVYGTGTPGHMVLDLRVDEEGNSYLFGQGSSESCSDCYGEFVIMKVRPNGDTDWLHYFENPVSKTGAGNAMTIDKRGNMYVGFNEGLGLARQSYLMKFNSSGIQQWTTVGSANASFYSLIADDYGGVFALGLLNSGYSHSVERYDSTGAVVWMNADIAELYSPDSGVLDTSGCLYVTNRYSTAKIEPTGRTAWLYRLPGSPWFYATPAIGLDDSSYVYLGGYASIGGKYDVMVMRLSQYGVYRPAAREKWIAGETDTIRWRDPGWATKNISCILNEGTPIEETIPVAVDVTSDSSFAWEIPNTLLSYKSRIIIANAADPSQTIKSGTFRLKPYRLTMLTSDSAYEPYRVESDRWGFGNSRVEMWPESYWSGRIDYQGTDPFTGMQYSQSVLDSVFAYLPPNSFPDWPSFVRAFGVSACYRNAAAGIYNLRAVNRWWDILGQWKGSCFGIAAANALAFTERSNFLFHFPSFPPFGMPLEVAADTSVINVVTPLFTQQFGRPTTDNDKVAWPRNPNQTVNDLKAMLREDEAPIRTLSFYNNNGSGGHTITAHWLEKAAGENPFYRVHVWDNSYPSVLDASIMIDTLGHGGTGIWWATHAWAGWGGAWHLILEVPSHEYFLGAMLPKNSLASANPVRTSPFALSDSVVEVLGFKQAGIAIQNGSGGVTGLVGGVVLTGIPGSTALQVRDGSESPPYGYLLENRSYEVTLDSAGSERLGLTLYTGKRLLSYERRDVLSHQQDRIAYDGGMRIANPDPEAKAVRLLAITGEASQDKLFALRGLMLGQADSLSIDNSDSNSLVFRSYGGARTYDLEVNLTSAGGLGQFVASGIQIGANSGHTIVPDWTDFAGGLLTIYVDEGNDGTVDDTVRLSNGATGADDLGSVGVPTEYSLAQNYPNPFNNSTTIRYALPHKSAVQLTVYNTLGQQVAVIEEGEKGVGYHEIRFNATTLSSGVYFYRLKAGNFTQTKKFLLLK
jgi:hypothetical protein